jgi:hypothetical protein
MRSGMCPNSMAMAGSIEPSPAVTGTRSPQAGIHSSAASASMRRAASRSTSSSGARWPTRRRISRPSRISDRSELCRPVALLSFEVIAIFVAVISG